MIYAQEQLVPSQNFDHKGQRVKGPVWAGQCYHCGKSIPTNHIYYRKMIDLDTADSLGHDFCNACFRIE